VVLLVPVEHESFNIELHAEYFGAIAWSRRFWLCD
jgi:hypothetical protein